MKNYRIEFFSTVKDAKGYMSHLFKLGFIPNCGVLFIDLHDKPIAAWVPDGRSGGLLFTRADVRKGKQPSHRYGGSADAYDFLKRSLSK